MNRINSDNLPTEGLPAFTALAKLCNMAGYNAYNNRDAIKDFLVDNPEAIQALYRYIEEYRPELFVHGYEKLEREFKDRRDFADDCVDELLSKPKQSSVAEKG